MPVAIPNAVAVKYQRLGKRVVGFGSHGVGFAAWDTAAAHLVAIKKQVATSDSAVRGMLLFQSTHVVLGNCYLVFPYLEATLHDVWKRACGFLDWGLAYRHGGQVLEGIAHLHKCSVARRDLSRSSVLARTRPSSVKVADVGMAVCAASTVLEKTVTTGRRRPPEVLLGATTLPATQDKLDAWYCARVCGAR